MVKTTPTDRLFFQKYSHKVLVRQHRGQAKADFDGVIEAIRANFADNNYPFKEKSSRTDSQQKLANRKEFKKGADPVWQVIHSLQGVTFYFSDPNALTWIETTHPTHMVSVSKVMSDAHSDALGSGIRTRVRSLFYKKYRYKVKFSGFLARQHNMSIGVSKNPALSLLTNRNPEADNNDLKAFLDRYDPEKWTMYNDGWDVVVYCTDAGMVTYLRLKYDTIIKELIAVKTLDEVA